MARVSKQLHVDDRESYFENPTSSYFNPQKRSVKLFWGEKSGSFIRHVPDNFCPPNTKGFALLRGYNCQAQCHYCFLQSYFKSGDMVKFTNIESYIPFLEKLIIAFQKKYGEDQRLVFFDGDFHDSLGYVGLQEDIHQINTLTEFFSQFKNVFLEIKSKCILELSPRITGMDEIYTYFEKHYSKLEIRHSLITAITFSPQNVVEQFEPGTATLYTRISFGKYIATKGGIVCPRIDPIYIDTDQELSENLELYGTLIQTIKEHIDQQSIYDRRIGTLRLKDSLYKKLKKDNSLLVKGLQKEEGFWKYERSLRDKVYAYCQEKIGSGQISVCMDD